MTDPIGAETARLLALFEATGARRIEADILQPAEALLDLYGEDIRGRAYVTHDALRGEQMLRPDFTVPVVQMHMAGGATPARYTYAGPVFRRQDIDATRPSEYPQVGYEVFGEVTLAEEEEAVLFALFHRALDGVSCRAVMGDMGILRAAVAALETSAERRAALLRHLWRPRRFRALLDRYSAAPPPLPAPESGAEIGLRSTADVLERRGRLEDDRKEPRLPAEARAALERLMGIAGPLPGALEALGEAARAIPAVARPLSRLVRRAEAFEALGLDLSGLDFEVTYGRTAMEYYDGFVFGFTKGDGPALASGGRYDPLTRALGGGQGMAALGGVIRPDLVAALRATAC